MPELPDAAVVPEAEGVIGTEPKLCPKPCPTTSTGPDPVDTGAILGNQRSVMLDESLGKVTKVLGIGYKWCLYSNDSSGSITQCDSCWQLVAVLRAKIEMGAVHFNS